MNLLPISSLIKYDHVVVNELYRNYVMNPGNLFLRQFYTAQFLRELTKHATAEETILYPAFEQYLGLPGKMMADKDRMEHLTTKQMMVMLAATPINHPQHPYIFASLVNNLNTHIMEEELQDLPRFESAITPYVSAMLAQWFQQTKLYMAPF